MAITGGVNGDGDGDGNGDGVGNAVNGIGGSGSVGGIVHRDCDNTRRHVIFSCVCIQVSWENNKKLLYLHYNNALPRHIPKPSLTERKRSRESGVLFNLMILDKINEIN